MLWCGYAAHKSVVLWQWMRTQSVVTILMSTQVLSLYECVLYIYGHSGRARQYVHYCCYNGFATQVLSLWMRVLHVFSQWMRIPIVVTVESLSVCCHCGFVPTICVCHSGCALYYSWYNRCVLRVLSQWMLTPCVVTVDEQCTSWHSGCALRWNSDD